MTSAAFLQDSLTVTPADDGLVAVTVLLPPELVKEYCSFLESLAGFFQAANRKGYSASAHSRAAASLPDRDAVVAAYASLLVTAYDQHIADGLTRTEAIRRISADLRDKVSPLVRSPPGPSSTDCLRSLWPSWSPCLSSG